MSAAFSMRWTARAEAALGIKQNTVDPMLILLLLVLGTALYFTGRYIMIRVATSHVPNHKNGDWFELAPDGIVSANGSPVTSRMRLGNVRGKVMVLFFGGGVSIDAYTAAHPYTTTDFLTRPVFTRRIPAA